MNPIEYQQAVAITAGILGGGFLGALIGTQTEARRRGMPLEKVNPFERVSVGEAARATLYACTAIVIVGLVLAAIVFGVMRIGGVDGFRGDIYKIFGASLLAGACLGKAVRFLYWKNKKTKR